MARVIPSFTSASVSASAVSTKSVSATSVSATSVSATSVSLKRSRPHPVGFCRLCFLSGHLYACSKCNATYHRLCLEKQTKRDEKDEVCSCSNIGLPCLPNPVLVPGPARSNTSATTASSSSSSSASSSAAARLRPKTRLSLPSVI